MNIHVVYAENVVCGVACIWLCGQSLTLVCIVIFLYLPLSIYYQLPVPIIVHVHDHISCRIWQWYLSTLNLLATLAAQTMKTA